MKILIPAAAKIMFSELAIAHQLERIFLHPDFYKSQILKKFLSFIVRETLTGNSICLKEYTIALKVLEKPVSFNPQRNCIVRIHAGRLRHALSRYYDDSGTDDPIIISIPKGKYIPLFMDRQHWLNYRKTSIQPLETTIIQTPREPVVIAILPFLSAADNELLQSFTDSLCLQICSTLSQLKQLLVIAYQAVRSLTEKYHDLKELASQVGFNHVISGGAQYVNDKIRLNIQIIDCNTYRQIWSKIYECKVTTSNLFDVQDEICHYILEQVKVLNEDISII